MSDENQGVTDGGQDTGDNGAAGGEDNGGTVLNGKAVEKAPAPAPRATAGTAFDADGDDGDNDDGDGGEGGADDAAAGKWRDDMSGGDAKLRKIAERFANPQEMLKWIHEQRTKNLKGPERSKPPKNASAEQIAEWRKANGVPEDVAGYGFKAEEGDEITPQVFDLIGNALLNAGAPKEVGEAIAAVYPEIEKLNQQMQAGADKMAYESLMEQAREDFGTGWKKEIQLGSSFIRERLGADVAEQLMATRLEDGSRLGNNYAILKFAAALAREMGGDDIITEVEAPGSTSLDARLDELYGLMTSDRARYESDTVQQEIARLEGVKMTRNARNTRRAA